ncbi:MAG: 4Fe-4S dicluster domain-containing protein [Candidatus Magnetobacterium sp. LHC-1]|uniref:4Fe-4S dicluster domain-containing protein n=1 Tax=Candidatus Magnetobacterium casense TaxID=1455061 RepID=A0ABS6S230_9BACT|nr:4Fe-4S dicluster domain-containing protein [Candidatus Magnetobacterium casensis]MBF0608458.1 4Fe-4S dicluster domain-containing protein [Nitrospirota bacterium]MBV6342901.1 4Fe-4S dicluster domain-containing protein [Candidatus Magnetobacterium casensis]
MTQEKKHKWVMVINPARCVGCYACVIACQNQNSLEIPQYYNRIEEREMGVYPHFSRSFLPVACQHCDNPPCVRVCPVGASYKRQDGVVMVDHNTCIGCKYCILACPYDVRIISKQHGYVHKCNFCIEHVQKGELPACVTTCPMGVRTFGDINDTSSEVHGLIGTRKTGLLQKELNTKPSVYYIL